MIIQLAMRNRAQPLALFSLMGIASRIAQRLGVHRDGLALELSPFQTEERRRIWWQLEHIELLISQLVGCIPMTLYADWDSKMPASIEDEDMDREIRSIPRDRTGLTSMSHCLWRYDILETHRKLRRATPDAGWITSKHFSPADRLGLIEMHRSTLAEKYLQYCEPVEPSHLWIQIGIQSFVAALQRAARQPGITSIKISDLSTEDRDAFLKACVKCMEYYVLAQTTPSIAGFRWHNECYFQWATCKWPCCSP